MKKVSKKRSETPIQGAVLDRLRSLTEQSSPGSKLPTVRKLIADFGVGQHVVQAALDKLRNEGLITSHVGKGTFVGRAGVVKPRTRSVLTLLYENPYLRGDVIARILHQRLSIDGHESLMLTYSNAAHVMDILRSGARYDAAILQPRASAMSVSLLALLKQRAEHVLIEGYAGDHLDVDSVSNDPAHTVELIVDHLFGLGHRRIAWITEDAGNYFFRRTAELFRAYCHGAGRPVPECPVIFAPTDPHRLGIVNLAASIQRLTGGGKTLPFTALVFASFVDGRAIVEALRACGLETPNDVAVVRLGTPDLESDHMGHLTIAGRSSAQAANTVLDRLQWRWNNPSELYRSYYDTPTLSVLGSTANRPGADTQLLRRAKRETHV